MIKTLTTAVAASTVILATPAAGVTETETPPPSTENLTPQTSPSPVLSPREKRKKQRAAKRKMALRKANRTRTSLVRFALRQKGKQYVAGGAGPRVFDCSGFTLYLYKTVAKKALPHYSGSQMRRGKKVGRKHLKPGDLLFYGPGGSQHVSMYIGKGKMIHATNPRTDVKIDKVQSAYWRGRYAGARRIIGQNL